MSTFRLSEVWISPQGVLWMVSSVGTWEHGVAYAGLEKQGGKPRRIELPVAATKGWTCAWAAEMEGQLRLLKRARDVAIGRRP